MIDLLGFWKKPRRYRINHRNCFNIFPLIPDEYIDLILSDPPFGMTANDWDVKLDLVLLFTHFRRIIKPKGKIVLFTAQPFTTDCVTAGRDMFRQERIWQKNRSSGFLNARFMPLRIHENILIFYKSPGTYNPQYTIGAPRKAREGKLYRSGNYKMGLKYKQYDNEGKRYPTTIIKADTVDRQKSKHPTEKPVPLLTDLILTYSNPGELVLDPFMGCGSAGVAALNIMRRFYGIEQNKEYYEIAKSRIERF